MSTPISAKYEMATTEVWTELFSPPKGSKIPTNFVLDRPMSRITSIAVCLVTYELKCRH